MKKKLVIGLLIVTILGVAAGSQLFNRTSAQDPPKKAEPAEKKVEGDLFDLLKKSLETKKVEPVVPAPFEAGLPPVKDDKVVLPPINSAPSVAPPLAVPPVSEVKPASTQPAISAPLNNPNDAPFAGPKPIAPAPPGTLVPDLPAKIEKAPMPVTQPFPPSTVPPFSPLSKDPSPVIPPISRSSTPPTVQIAPTKQPIPAQLAALKDCPWSLQVDLIEGKTVVTATVNKKHEFKIVCQSLDLQTGKSVLKAAGKVQITGDMMNGSCEHLSISLHEDRLLLEGAAELSIQKMATKVSSEASTSFELKGQTLDLRISDYTSAKLIQTSGMRSGNVVEAALTRTTSSTLPSADSKKWTSYGTLRPAKLDLGGKEIAWSLQDRDGKVITYLVARDGGTLRQYEGQTISVLGATEQFGGRSMLRVTHIALP